MGLCAVPQVCRVAVQICWLEVAPACRIVSAHVAAS